MKSMRLKMMVLGFLPDTCRNYSHIVSQLW